MPEFDDQGVSEEKRAGWKPGKCRTCVKAIWSREGKFLRCQVLSRVPASESCWAYSDDPQFWEKLRQAVARYKETHGDFEY